MKIALAQMNVLPGQPRKNLEKMLEMIERAKAEKADLVAFPEMCIGGYLLGDAWTDEAWCRDLMAYGEEVRKASHGIAVAFGNVYMEEEPQHGWQAEKVQRGVRCAKWKMGEAKRRTSSAPKRSAAKDAPAHVSHF